MTDNPFAPPASDVEDPQLSLGTISIGRCYEEGWAATKRHFPLWLGVMLVWFIASLGAMVTCIGLLLALPHLYWGWINFTLKMHDGDPRMDNLWEGFQQYGKVLAAMIVLYLIQVLLGIPGQIPQMIGQAMESMPLVFIGMGVNLIWMAFVTLRIYFAPMLVVDRDMEPVDAVKRSWDLTRGQQKNLILLMLLTALIVMIGMLLLLVGIFPAMILATMMWVSAYRQLTGGPETRTREERIEDDWNAEPA